METSIKAAIATAQAQNRFVNKTELQAAFSWVQQGQARIEAAEYLHKNSQLLIDAASQSVSLLENKVDCAESICYYLQLMQYCLIADSTDPIDEYLIINLNQINGDSNLYLSCMIEALNYIQSNQGLTDEAAIQVNRYIDYAINTLVKFKQNQTLIDQTTNGKSEVEITYDYTMPPVWEQLLKLGVEIPQEEWTKFPKDFARNLEHYMYGASKEE